MQTTAHKHKDTITTILDTDPGHPDLRPADRMWEWVLTNDDYDEELTELLDPTGQGTWIGWRDGSAARLHLGAPEDAVEVIDSPWFEVIDSPWWRRRLRRA